MSHRCYRSSPHNTAWEGRTRSPDCMTYSPHRYYRCSRRNSPSMCIHRTHSPDYRNYMSHRCCRWSHHSSHNYRIHNHQGRNHRFPYIRSCHPRSIRNLEDRTHNPGCMYCSPHHCCMCYRRRIHRLEGRGRNPWGRLHMSRRCCKCCRHT